MKFTFKQWCDIYHNATQLSNITEAEHSLCLDNIVSSIKGFRDEYPDLFDKIGVEKYEFKIEDGRV